MALCARPGNIAGHLCWASLMPLLPLKLVNVNLLRKCGVLRGPRYFDTLSIGTPTSIQALPAKCLKRSAVLVFSGIVD